MTSENPLLERSALPFELPDYAGIRPEHYLPAFEQGMAEQRAEIDALLANPEPPTFDNTLVAWERSGETLGRVSRTFFTLASADATAEIQAIEETVAPLLSAHHDAIGLDPALYARVGAVNDRVEEFEGEDRRLIERRFREMTLGGAGLDADARARLTEINGRLSMLTTAFDKNLLADTNDLAVVFDDVTDLDGLDAGAVSAAARAASDRGLGGRWVIPPHT